MGWYRDFKDFTDATTAHGIKYIFRPPLYASYKCVRLVFLLAWVTALLYSFYVICVAISKYGGHPTGTKFQVISESQSPEHPDSIRFPTISVCSHNTVSQSYFDNNTDLEELWSELYYVWDPDAAGAIDFSEGAHCHKYKDWTYQKIVKEGGPANWTFLQCNHFLNLCQDVLAEQDFLEMETTHIGQCFRINPNGKLWGKGGDYGKIQLIFFADLNEYSGAYRLQPQHGFSLMFHDHETYSATIDSGIWMSPGSIYKVDLSMTKEFREPPPAGSCDPARVNTTYGRYTENSCIAQCRDDAMMRKCGCVHITPPHPEAVPEKEYRPCTLEQWAKCGLKAHKEWLIEYSDVDYKEAECVCPPACRELDYKAQLSSSTLSKLYAEDHAQYLSHGYNGTSDVLENLVVIEVLFTSMQVSEIREIVTYTWANFLGDVGGVLGLFLGASLFTVMEFVEFFFVLWWKTFWGEEKEEREEDESVSWDGSDTVSLQAMERQELRNKLSELDIARVTVELDNARVTLTTPEVVDFMNEMR